MPLSDPNDDFWQSNFLDICLSSWGASEKAGSAHPFYWHRGKAAPPVTSSENGALSGLCPQNPLR